MNSASLSQSAPTRSRRLFLAAVLGSLAAIGPLSIDMYLPALPALAEELQTSASLTQLSLTAFLLGIALGQLIVGPISDVRGRRYPLIFGVVAYTLVSFLCVIAPSIWTFVLLRLGQGLAGAAAIVVARASVRDLYSGVELTRFLALLMLVNGAAPIFAPIIGANILTVTSWRGVFAVLGFLGVLMLVAVMFGLKETLPPERRSKGGMGNMLMSYKKLLGNRTFVGYALTQGFMMASMFAYISGSTFVLQQLFGVSPKMFSLIFGLNGLGLIIATQIAGRLAGRIEARRMLGFGLSIAAAGALLLMASALMKLGLAFVIPAFFLVVSSIGVISTTTTSLSLQDQGKSAGSASALLGMLSFIFGGVAAPLVGLGGETTAVPLAAVMLLMVALAVVSFILLTGQRKKAA
jgi:DHA1 family bicyclomycin/chloramphenicol resistance-like MFS transporter